MPPTEPPTTEPPTQGPTPAPAKNNTVWILVAVAVGIVIIVIVVVLLVCCKKEKKTLPTTTDVNKKIEISLSMCNKLFAILTTLLRVTTQ